MNATDLHTAWSRLFVHSLASAGVTDVVLSPGSRSTPLALAVAHTPALRVHVAIDERTAAFFALGQARVTGRPSVLVCTSGTAAAHYLPAVIEASLSRLPLVIVTADRPWEAYDNASPQTIDQVKLFGAYVRGFWDVGVPDASPGALRAVVRLAAQSVHTSLWPQPGPVHLDAHFRKPLEPVEAPAEESWAPFIRELIAQGTPGRTVPRTSVELGTLPSDTWVVCGPHVGAAPLPEIARALADRIADAGFALLAEATSGLRFAGSSPSMFDTYLRAPSFAHANLPGAIVEIGLPPTSTAYASFVASHPDVHRVVVAPGGWNDPHGTAREFVFGDLASVLHGWKTAPRVPERSWRVRLNAADARVTTAIERVCDGDAWHEGVVVRTLIECLPPGATLVAGNSLSVRDLDTFVHAHARELRVLHQRGASGIDGLIAGTVGTSTVTPGVTAVLLGDVSALHDVGALVLARTVSSPLIVLVVDNGGGRIFDQLPLARNAALDRDIARLFRTPQDIPFDEVARAFGIRAAVVRDSRALGRAVAGAVGHGGATVIRAVVDGAHGMAVRRAIWGSVEELLAGET